jgi:hypothetical protein
MEVIEFIKDYTLNPDKQKSVCLPEVIEHFEVMPSMNGKISQEELEEVSSWIFEYEIPKETK